MTREEAIDLLKMDIHNAKVSRHKWEHYDMAIKSLEDFELQYRKGFEDGLRHGDYSTKSEFGKSMIHLETKGAET